MPALQTDPEENGCCLTALFDVSHSHKPKLPARACQDLNAGNTWETFRVVPVADPRT